VWRNDSSFLNGESLQGFKIDTWLKLRCGFVPKYQFIPCVPGASQTEKTNKMTVYVRQDVTG
jgi:hypothetical protein